MRGDGRTPDEDTLRVRCDWTEERGHQTAALRAEAEELDGDDLDHEEREWGLLASHGGGEGSSDQPREQAEDGYDDRPRPQVAGAGRAPRAVGEAPARGPPPR